MADFSQTNARVAEQFPGVDISRFSHVDLNAPCERSGHELRYVPHEGMPGYLGDLNTGRFVPPRQERAEYVVDHDPDDSQLRDEISIVDPLR